MIISIILKKKKRQNKILAILRAMQKEVHVEELTTILGVSSLTIRRDLIELAEDKSIIRTYGGCFLAGRVALESEYHKKVALNFDLKQSIGRQAVLEINPGDLILIDDGSTTFHLATNLGNIHPLTIYTNSLVLVTELSRYADITLNILGGEINQESYSVSGAITEKILENIHFDKVFMGIDALDENGNCIVKSASMARLAQIMLRSGKEKILLGDHTKVKVDSGFWYATLNDFDLWITTTGIEKKQLDLYKKMTKVSH